MMSLTELVSTALLLVIAIAAAQKPTTIADASIEVTEQERGDEMIPEVLGELEDRLDRKLDYKRNEISGKDLDSEEYSDEYDYGDDDDNIDYDYDSDENEEEEEEADDESNLRVKRKVIFGGGGAGGGGIYSRGGRRGGGEEDPYGRRREYNGPMYGPPESWPYRRPDLPSHAQNAGQVTPSTTGSSPSTGIDSSAPVYGTPRLSPEDDGSSSSTISSRRSDSRKTKPNRRDTQKGKLSKSLKWEIAQYAMQHGPEQAAQHFEDRVGRRLRVKKIEKFIQRYQTKN